MIRLVQFLADGKRRVGLSSESPSEVNTVAGYSRVYDLALAAIRDGVSLRELVQSKLTGRLVDYDALVTQRRLLPPLDHPDPARSLVTLTGLTHLGSAASRDLMHIDQVGGEELTDSARMFRIGVAGGKPPPGQVGAQPEWAYKGDGRSVVAPEWPIPQPAFAHDGGEEAEIVALYLIGDDGTPWRVGYAIGNEFSDHVLEQENYLYLAHSKLRQCAFGPELLVGELPASISGTTRIVRGEQTIWSSPFESGEANMCHSIANLEHHHFKYPLFRRPGDVHVHFLGANGLSFGSGVQTQAGDTFEIDVPVFGRPLRNTLEVEADSPLVEVRSL